MARFLKRAQRLASIPGEVNLLLAGNARIQALNKQFRGKNKPTDVLSFPAAPNAQGLAGDLAISVEIAAQQAAERGHSLDLELRILALHGLLHLAGHDHEADTGEMRSLETGLQARLKLPTGLIERASTAPGKRASTAPVERSSSAQKPAPAKRKPVSPAPASRACQTGKR